MQCLSNLVGKRDKYSRINTTVIQWRDLLDEQHQETVLNLVSSCSL